MGGIAAYAIQSAHASITKAIVVYSTTQMSTARDILDSLNVLDIIFGHTLRKLMLLPSLKDPTLITRSQLELQTVKEAGI